MLANVLVADNSTTMRKIIVRSLAAAGVKSAVEAADGDEALSLFKTGNFDMVLTDSVLTDTDMPGTSGVDMIREMRKQNQQIPIIVVATEAHRGQAQQALDAGGSDFLVKPFSAEVLRKKLVQHGG
ncbi:MAG: response regulator [Planctomycetia bacterium]|nr:response regulator [Planctomycetia bacterium]